MKFIVYIDYQTSYKPMGYDYKAIEAKTIEEAIETADKMWNPDTCYLMRIMKKSGKVEKNYGYNSEEYTAILCKRSTNWHRNTTENGENEHKAKKFWMPKYKDETWYEAI